MKQFESGTGAYASASVGRKLEKLEKRDTLSLAGFAFLCAALSFALGHTYATRNAQSVENLFHSNIAEVRSLVVQRMQLYEYGVRGARGAVASVGFDHFTRAHYLKYAASRDFDREFPGARGFGVIYRVPNSQLAQVEASLRVEYDQNTSVRSLGEHEGDKYIIRYLEPYARNKSAIGLDIASEINRKTAADLSAISGKATLTGPITVLQALEKKDSAFLLLLPIYDTPNSNDATAQAKPMLKGWAYSVLVFNEIIQHVNFAANHLAVRLTDVTDASNSEPFYSTDGWHVASHELKDSIEFQVHGRTWRMEVSAMPSIYLEPQPYNMGFTGFLLVLVNFSLFVVAYLLLVAKQRSVIEQRHQLALTGSIIEASSMGSLLVDSEGRIVRLNRRIAEMFGYAEKELLGQMVEMLVPTEIRAVHVKNREEYDGRYLQMANQRQIFGLRANGETFPLEVTLNSIHVNDKRYVLAGISDITERVRFLSRIQESEASWRGLANSLPQLVWTMNAEGQVDFLSDQWGARPTTEQHADAQFHSSIHPEDCARVMEMLAQAMQNRTSGQTECRLKRLSDADYEWYDMQLVSFKDDAGHVLKWIGSNTNIQLRKKAETEILALNTGLECTVQERTAALQKAQQNLSDILNSVPSMIGYWNRHLSNELANRPLQEFIDKARQIQTDSEKGNLFEQLFDINSIHIQAALSGRPIRFEQQVWLSTDMPSYFDIHYIPHQTNQKIVGLYVLMQDISEARRAQLHAELISRQKSSFLAVMSHEIRTPLNGILGLAGLLAEKIQDEELKKDAVFLRGNAQTLTVILNDILDISKVESGKLKLEHVAFNLKEQVDSCCMLHQIPAQEKGVAFKAHYTGFNAETTLAGDPTRLRQVLHNLLSNAVKFTSAGQVSLKVDYRRGNDEVNVLCVEVADSGVGIPKESQGSIFQPFYQAESSTFRKFGGTGLGLSVIKAIVSAMSGKLWFNSEPNVGTTFFVEVPLEELHIERPLFSKDNSVGFVSPRHILIVDDMPLNLKVLRKILEHDQHRVEQASDGLSAFELCETTKFDLIFLDISMPGMDGYETAQKIRGQSALNKFTPIVALSGHAFDEDIQKSLACGMTAHLSKPIDVDRIRQRIFELT
ncbi:CHASE domain-containing protein [Limnobacter sp.]|uniref:CHASE domain-containing protein n=1 Tax=Limnobacter sp. TaxID=2003368 RepID=UPI003748D895